MVQVIPTIDTVTERANLAPQQANAVLFCRLAQFVVWGQAHGDLAAAHPDLALLLQAASAALSKCAVFDNPVSSAPAQTKATNPVSDSESLACAFVSKGQT